MKTVKFTEMKNGSKDDYQLLEKLEKKMNHTPFIQIPKVGYGKF